MKATNTHKSEVNIFMVFPLKYLVNTILHSRRDLYVNTRMIPISAFHNLVSDTVISITYEQEERAL